MKLDPVFIMFLVTMGIIIIVIFLMTINEKKDSELSIADIEFYKRLKMVKFNIEGWNNTFVTASQTEKGLKNAMNNKVDK